ncbi:unnamed protein product [Orchesella dallaii]|uniref:C3H1-type domain-containing protein n=1 Tax=Orchesella dallaii TaxID=48710 RepID=A0ABP1QEQ5_9HEXA
MIVDDLVLMHEWLTAILRPLCDADPEALGKYVLALLKKNMAEEELRRSMSEQLDIFLQEKTQPFIDKLFEHIHTNEYNAMTTSQPNKLDLDSNGNTLEAASNCEPTDESSNTTDRSLNAETSESSICVEDKPEPDAGLLECNKVEINSVLDERTEIHSNNSMSSVGSASSEAETTEIEPRKTRPGGGNVTLKVGSNWRAKRSLSRSSESSHGSNKRHTSFSRRPLRPHVLRHRQRATWSPLRRRTRRDPGCRRSEGRLLRSPLENRSISPKKRLVPLCHKRSSFSKSRSRSQSPHKNKRLACKVDARAPSPDNDSLLDNINNKCSVKSMIVRPDARDQPNSDEKLRNTRCRDFDEKGLCLRGELCPYDHGTDPFVLEDVVGPSTSAPTNFGPKAPVPMDKPMTNFINMFNPSRHPSGNGEYYPESPAIGPPFGWNSQARPRQQFRPRHLNFDSLPFTGRGGMPHPSMMRPYGLHMPRQLVTIPVDGSLQPSPSSSFGEHSFPGGPWMNRGVFGMRGRGRGVFDFRRLGTRPGGKQMGNCCLEVRKIPKDLNTIEALISHFSRFGSVVSIQTNLDNDPEGALVTFSNQDEAFQAYRSADAVLNNRFIRVFWYCKEKDHNRSNQFHDDFNHISEPGKSKYTSEQPFQHPVPTFIPVKGNERMPVVDPQFAKAIADDLKNTVPVKDDLSATNQPRSTNSEPVPQPLEPVLETPKKIPNMNYSAELLKTREGMMSLMTAQIEEQKRLILNLETNRDRMTAKQQDDIKKLIGNLQKSCQELRLNLGVLNTNLAQTSTSNNNGYPKICSKEEVSIKS